MPILDAELTLFPENLLDCEGPLVPLGTPSEVVSVEPGDAGTAAPDTALADTTLANTTLAGTALAAEEWSDTTAGETAFTGPPITGAPTTDAAVTDALDYDPSDLSGRTWSAMHTKARQEKSLARELLAYQIPFYLPLVAKTNLIRGRKVESFIPLFGGYLFVFGTPDERERCLRTNRICQTIAVEDNEALTRDLRNIRKLINLKAPLTVESQLTPGRRVRILSGSLMGMEGTVVERRRETRLVVAVQFLQQGVSLEIDDFQLEPID